MADRKNDQNVNEEKQNKGIGEISEAAPFASLNKILEESPEFKNIFDLAANVYDDDLSAEEMVEVECVEIDGDNYFAAKRIEIAGTTYLCLVNENDVMDYVIQKVVIEDGEEYVTGLDSDREFDLVQAYIQRDFLVALKEKLQKADEGTPGDQ